jgi:hypothetical protein
MLPALGDRRYLPITVLGIGDNQALKNRFLDFALWIRIGDGGI